MDYEIDNFGDASSFLLKTCKLALPLNVEVKVDVEVKTEEDGIYSAIMRLREAGKAYEACAVLLTVVCAPKLNEANRAMEFSLKVDRPGVESIFFDVPENAKRVHITAQKDTEELLVAFFFPPRHHLADGLVRRIWLRKGERGITIDEPETGVWEIYVNNRAMLGDEVVIKSASRDPILRERLGRSGMGEKMEPRPSPLTPTAVVFQVACEI